MRRSDGYYIKDINPYTKMLAHILTDRADSMNMCNIELPCEKIDAFIKEYAAKGEYFSLNDIMMTAYVRLFAMRPALNRFVMHKKIYQHNDITACFVIKKKMVDESEDTVVKLHFTGEEDLRTVKKMMYDIVKQSRGENINGVDKTADMFAKTPHWLFNIAIGIIRFLDNRNMLPKSLIEVSPFHNSLFVTFLNSIKGEALLHHCYNFGTTGIFIGMGTPRKIPVVKDDQVVVENSIPVGIVVDERLCDGLYYVNSFKVLKKLVSEPEKLLERYEIDKNKKELSGTRSDKEQERFNEKLREEKKNKKK